MPGNAFTEWLSELRWLQEGDVLYVVSDMMDLAIAEKKRGMRLNLDRVIEGLQELLGHSGTLLFPTFNWDFCKGVPFDYKKTQVKTGALPKAALKRDDFIRTEHPLYSFAIWGKRQEELAAIQTQNSFGPGTVFEKMGEWDAKVLVIGLPALAGVTYIHHVEQIVGVPYRYNKEFTGDYLDASGHLERRTFRMYVRDLNMDPRHINGFEPLAQQMQKDGLIADACYDSVSCHFLRVLDLEKAVRRDILENDSRKMYVYVGQKARDSAE